MKHSLSIRRGFSLVELLLSMAILGLIVGAVGVLTEAAHRGNEYTQSIGMATQHARVAVQRIALTVASGYGVGDEPGVAVIETVDGINFPDTLVVWAPAGKPANEAGPPLVNELVFFTPNPADPHELWEVTAPSDARTASLITINSAGGRSLLAEILASGTSVKRTVMRRAQTVSSVATDHPMLRFSTRMRPSAAEWADYQADTIAWEDIHWPQSLYGQRWGTRVVSVNVELWTTMSTKIQSGVDPQDISVPFFGSAALSYRMEPKE